MSEEGVLIPLGFDTRQLAADLAKSQAAINSFKRDAATPPTSPGQPPPSPIPDPVDVERRSFHARQAIHMLSYAMGAHLGGLLQAYHAWHMFGGALGLAVGGLMVGKMAIDAQKEAHEELVKTLDKTIELTREWRSLQQGRTLTTEGKAYEEAFYKAGKAVAETNEQLRDMKAKRVTAAIVTWGATEALGIKPWGRSGYQSTDYLNALGEKQKHDARIMMMEETALYFEQTALEREKWLLQMRYHGALKDTLPSLQKQHDLHKEAANLALDRMNRLQARGEYGGERYQAAFKDLQSEMKEMYAAGDAIAAKGKLAFVGLGDFWKQMATAAGSPVVDNTKAVEKLTTVLEAWASGTKAPVTPNGLAKYIGLE